MRNSTDEAELMARIKALEALVVVLAQHLSADHVARRQINDLIDREVQSFNDDEDPAGASAMRTLQDDLEVALSF